MTSFITALLLLLQIGTQPATLQQRSIEKASIEGVILRSESGEPLARAEVKLSRVLKEEDGGKFVFFDGSDPETQGLPSVLTESDGRFLLNNLEPGQYRLTVTRNGYAQQLYGQKVANGPGRIIHLLPGEAMKNVVFRMIPAGIVTGRIRDSAGEPVAGLNVALMRIDYAETRRTLWDVDTTQTDDRGEYRFFWIQPGRYYLRVNQSFMYGPRKVVADPTIPTTYYPGTLDPASAAAIEVQPGSEAGAVDIVLPKALGHWIRGRVVDASTGKPPKSVGLSVIPKQRAAIVDSVYGEQTKTDYNAATGLFAIRNVVPGSYWLFAGTSNGFDEAIPADRLAEVRTGADVLEAVFSAGTTAHIAIDMPPSDLNDVVITLTRGSSVPVRLRVEGRELASVKDIDKVRLSLGAVERDDSRESTRLNAEGVARIENVLPGEYKATVSVPKSMELYVKEILYGRNDALIDPVQITDQQPGMLTVLLSDRGGRIEGTLTDALAQPVSGVEVVLIPDLRERTNLYKTVTTDRDGHFVFSSPARRVQSVFWEALPPNAYYHREILSNYETQGRSVQIQELSKPTVDLKIIPGTTQ